MKQILLLATALVISMGAAAQGGNVVAFATRCNKGVKTNEFLVPVNYFSYLCGGSASFPVDVQLNN